MADLCTHCRLMTITEIGLAALTSDKGYKHYSLDDLDKSTTNHNCRFCKWLSQTIKYYETDTWTSRVRINCQYPITITPQWEDVRSHSRKRHEYNNDAGTVPD